MTNSRPTYFTICPNLIRYDSRLTPLARLIYTEFLLLANNEQGYCYVGNTTLSQWYSVNHATISRCIKQLEQYGYIKVKRSRKNNKHLKNKIYIVDNVEKVLQKCNIKEKSIANVQQEYCKNANAVLHKCDSNKTSKTNTRTLSQGNQISNQPEDFHNSSTLKTKREGRKSEK
ncbi:MAG: helix-turn-helix domain-containing protein [Coriobacteriia bacterium]|nr:helix-turn-helix domain-containing protein [Coriobacteriia bacterium]